MLINIIVKDMGIFGAQILNVEDLIKLLIRFSLNLIVLTIIVRWLYYSITRRKDYLFIYYIIGSVIFLMCFLLENVKVEMGFALGLFAIFGIIRYRTQQVPIKEMTYLFLVIGLSVINALSNKKISYAELVLANLAIIGLTYGLEKIWLLRHESTKVIVYEKINLIKPEARQELIEDLQNRTGIKKINRVEIGKIDFLRDTARLKIFYFDEGSAINTADDETITSDNGGDDDE